MYVHMYTYAYCLWPEEGTGLPETEDTHDGEPPWGAGINPGTFGIAASVNC